MATAELHLLLLRRDALTWEAGHDGPVLSYCMDYINWKFLSIMDGFLKSMDFFLQWMVIRQEYLMASLMQILVGTEDKE
jgi:hypothetical protein